VGIASASLGDAKPVANGVLVLVNYVLPVFTHPEEMLKGLEVADSVKPAGLLCHQVGLLVADHHENRFRVVFSYGLVVLYLKFDKILGKKYH